MSIISDALRKAEQERELKAKLASQESNSTAVLEEPVILPDYADEIIHPKPKVSKVAKEPLAKKPVLQIKTIIRVFAVVVFLCVSVLLSVAIIFFIYRLIVLNLITVKPRRISFPIVQTEPVQVKTTMIPQSKMEKSVVVQHNQLPYTLSGVTHVGNDHYAIINGAIVQIEDTVDGAHVKAISEREVVLETRDGEIKLKLAS